MHAVPNLSMGIGLFDKSVVHPSDASSISMPHVIVEGERLRAIDRDTVDRLKEDILRQGLLQPIGVKATKGARGGPYRLMYGLTRFTAMQELHAEGKAGFNIPAIVFPEHLPDWRVKLAEISENLIRKELSAPERDAHTTMYAGIIKKHGDVAKTKGGRPVKESVNAVHTLPTVTNKVAADLGVTREAVTHRVARTVKAAGLNGVTIDRSDGDTLIKAGEIALAKVPDTLAARKKKADEAHAKGAARNAHTQAQKKGEAVTIGDVTAEPIDTAPLLAVLDQWEAEHGIGLVQSAIQAWWRKRHPPGRVVFNREHGNGVS